MTVAARRRRGTNGTVLATVLALAVLPAAAGPPPDPGPYFWQGIPRVVAVGDVHGAGEELDRILLGAGLVDGDGRWSGGGDHLVLVGDLLDRGPSQRAVLDTVRRLQRQAADAGGRVHVLLGNHEVMNLVRDFRYVTPAGFADFEQFERPEDRKRAWRHYRKVMRDAKMDRDQLRESFEQRYPAGYFGRVRALGPDGPYGAWLLDQAVVVWINGIVFVHGGLTEEVAELGITEINRRVIEEIREFWRGRARMEKDGAVGPCCSFEEVMHAAGDIRSSNVDPPAGEKVRDAAGEALAFLRSMAVSPDGPLWYRGLALENERIERARFERTLKLLSARSMVVGHSITGEGYVTSRFGGRLYRTDVGMQHRSRPMALVFEEGKARVLDPTTGRFLAVLPEAPQGEGSSGIYADYPDSYLQDYLRRARVREVRELGRGSTRPLLVELTEDGSNMRAVFKSVNEENERARRFGDTEVPVADRYRHEIAAYLLDRELGLGQVPVTIERRIEGHGTGSLQRWIDSAVDQISARTNPLPPEYLEHVTPQLARMRVFDALIGNPDRSDADVLHLPRENRLLLVDHSKAFSTSSDLELFLGRSSCVLDHDMEQAMRALGRREAQHALQPWLTKSQVQALLDRRDGLLERCGTVPY